MKFILVMLAVLLPVGVMLAELDSKANLIDTVSMSSGGGRILLIGGYTMVRLDRYRSWYYRAL